MAFFCHTLLSSGIGFVVALLCGLIGFGSPGVAAEGTDAVLLVASKSLNDAHFGESVILVAHRDRGGAMGLILNRSTRLTVKDLFAEGELESGSDATLFFGGPVSPDTVSFLYRSSTPREGSVRAFGHTYMSGDRALLLQILADPVARRDLRVFSGYAGWAPGQLDMEIGRGSWHILPARDELIFERDSKSIWGELIAKLSGKWI